MRYRVVGAGLAVVALVAVVVTAAGAYFGYRHGGPLSGFDHAGVSWPTASGKAFTWAMPLPANSATTDIVFDSIAPVGVSNLEVLGVMVSTQGCSIPTISTAYPPPGISIADPQGAHIVAMGDPCAMQALLGVRRSTDAAHGTIDGLRIRYHFEGAAYEDVLPYSLDVRDPGT
jgi:hypothetical protein